VVEGLLTRDVVIGDRSCAELLGPGDVLRPLHSPGDGAVSGARVEWQVLERTRLAILNRQVVRALSAYPEITVGLVARAVVRAKTLAVVLAISCVTRLEVRVLALLWHLADRFGKVSPQGVVVPLPLTHQVISRLVGASRPSVSTTVKQLEDGGHIARRQGGGYLLLGEPPELGEGVPPAGLPRADDAQAAPGAA
jgi:CRP/FNR family transcriptional regulator, cyclic AMP receptor protein